MSKTGYIYIIKADTGHYKIGRTNNIPNRMSLFAVKLPFDFEIIHTFPCDDSIEAERILHDAYTRRGYHAKVNGLFYLMPTCIHLSKSVALKMVSITLIAIHPYMNHPST